MTITIVASLAKPSVAATPTSHAADTSAAAADPNSGLDFAGILLIQATAAKQALANEETPLNSEHRPVDTGEAAANPQILATLVLLPAAPPALEVTAVDEPAAASPARVTADTPARFAVADLAAFSPLQAAAGEPDPVAATGRTPALALATAATAATAAALTQEARHDLQAPLLEQSSSTLAVPPQSLANGTAMSHELPHDLQIPLRAPSWGNEFGQKLLWFAANDRHLAQLTVNPPQLGSIEIRLNMDKDNASACFASANADVRGAIEAAVPRLREMFASAGLELGQVSIGSESFGQRRDEQADQSRQPRRPADNAILAGDSAAGLPTALFVRQRGHGLIDIFA